MKKILLIAALSIFTVLFVNSCSNETTSPSNQNVEFVYMPENKPSNFYEIDVKTKYLDKWNETGVKNGAISYLNNQDWCKIVETGEDYSLWIKDLSRDNSKLPEVTITFNLELQAPTFQFETTVYKKKNFTLTYNSDNELENTKGNVDAQLVADRFKQYAEKAMLAGKISAYVNNMFIKNSTNPYAQIASFIIDYIVKVLGDKESWKIKQIEAVIAGAEIAGTLQNWLYELEH